jgi:hypothetical protein
MVKAKGFDNRDTLTTPASSICKGVAKQGTRSHISAFYSLSIRLMKCLDADPLFFQFVEQSVLGSHSDRPSPGGRRNGGRTSPVLRIGLRQIQSRAYRTALGAEFPDGHVADARIHFSRMFMRWCKQCPCGNLLINWHRQHRISAAIFLPESSSAFWR